MADVARRFLNGFGGRCTTAAGGASSRPPSSAAVNSVAFGLGGGGEAGARAGNAVADAFFAIGAFALGLAEGATLDAGDLTLDAFAAGAVAFATGVLPLDGFAAGAFALALVGAGVLLLEVF